MEFERKTSSGVAKAGLTTGIIGTSLGALAALGGGASLLGGWGARNNAAQGAVDAAVIGAMMSGTCARTHDCAEDHLVTRYDAEKDARIAELETQVALRDSNTYTDQKSLEMYRYVDGRLRDIESQICQQAVVNQATNDKIQLVKQESDCCCARLEQSIATERSERKCADNSIVNYVNQTFYPQMIADITVGTTATKEKTYNPLPCTCSCGNNQST